MLYLYLFLNISTGFQVFLKSCYKAKARHHNGCDASSAATAANVPMGAGLQVPSGPEDQRQPCRNPAKGLAWRFSCHNQKQRVKQLFLSTINPFSQEISWLLLQTQVFDSSNNLLINYKEAFSGRDYKQADFALPKSMRVSAIDFQDIPARLNICF